MTGASISLFVAMDKTNGPPEDLRAMATPSASASMFDRYVFAALIAGLAFSPLWFGGNRPIAWAINAIWSSVLVFLYECRLLARGILHPVAIRMVWPAALAFVAVACWCLVQVSTAVPASYQHPIWDVARGALRLNIPGSISVSRDATLLALLRLVTAASVFWLSLQLCRSRYRARWLIKAVALVGLVYALYGLVAFFVFPKTILWFEKSDYLDALTSTFVNRNSYATYADVGLLAAMGMTISSFASSSVRASVGRQAASFVASLSGPAGVWLGISAVIAVALICTASRGGIIAGAIGLLIGSVLVVAQRRRSRSRAIVAGILALLVFVSIAAGFGDLLAGRLSSEGLQSDTRLAVYRTTTVSIVDRPLEGFGYGTFDQVFPMYRGADTIALLKWDKAHNTYLEVFQGLGLPFSMILFAGVGFLVWRCFFAAVSRRRNLTAPLVASAVSAAVLAHAFVDFSLQIQGVTLTWIAILGSGVAQSWSSKMDTSLAEPKRAA